MEVGTVKKCAIMVEVPATLKSLEYDINKYQAKVILEYDSQGLVTCLYQQE